MIDWSRLGPCQYRCSGGLYFLSSVYLLSSSFHLPSFSSPTLHVIRYTLYIVYRSSYILHPSSFIAHPTSPRTRGKVMLNLRRMLGFFLFSVKNMTTSALPGQRTNNGRECEKSVKSSNFLSLTS